nr:uncharacterized protein LOC111421503 [Onthophagus taurus]
MFITSSVNIPLAIFTVILRRLIDRLRDPPPALQVVVSGNFLQQYPNFKPIVYGYVIFAVLRYVIKHVKRGTMMDSIRKLLTPAKSCRSKPKLTRFLTNESWMLRNLTKNRSSKHKALSFVSTLIDDESVEPTSSRYGTENTCTCGLSTTMLNPYFIPKLNNRKNDEESREIEDSNETVDDDNNGNSTRTCDVGCLRKRNVRADRDGVNAAELAYTKTRSGKKYYRVTPVRKKNG